MRIRYGVLYLSTVFVLATLTMSFSGRNHTPQLAPPAVEANLGGQVPDLTGAWVGSWADTIYGVSGALGLVLVKNGSVYTALGGIDLFEIDPLLNGGEALTGSGSGTESGGTLNGTFTCANLGSGSVMLTGTFARTAVASATASGSGSVTAPLGYGPFVFNGTVTDNAMTGIFDFTNPSGGAGTGELIKIPNPVQETTWGQMKAKYRRQ